MAERDRSRRRGGLAPLACVALALCAIAVLGCGGSEGDAQRTAGVTEDFIALVGEIDEAARAGEAFDGLERAAELEPQEREALEAFCLTAWKLDVQDETDRLANTRYIVDRIKLWAEYDFAHKDSPVVAAALARLRRDTELASWDAATDRRYKGACYG